MWRGSKTFKFFTVLFCFWEPDPPCSRCSFKRGLKQQTNNDDCHDPKISILCKSQLILSVLNEIKILSSFVLVIIVVLIYCICRNWILLHWVSTKISASLFFSKYNYKTSINSDDKEWSQQAIFSTLKVNDTIEMNDFSVWDHKSEILSL